MTRIKCLKCNGTGTLPHYINIANGTCFQCKGAGYFEGRESKEQQELENKMKENEERELEYDREQKELQKKQEEKKEQQKEKNVEKYKEKLKYYGSVGEKVKLTVSHKNSFFNKAYTKYVFIDSDNHTLIWNTKESFLVMDMNNVEMEATIKEHKDYKGFKQTILKDVTILNHIDVDELDDDQLEEFLKS